MTLNEYLDEIEKVSKEKTDDRLKTIIIGRYWGGYLKQKELQGIGQNNQLYINDTKLNVRKVSIDNLASSIERLKNKNLKEEDISNILDWVISNLYEQLKKISIDMNLNTLDGFCELSQLITIYPLEELGLKVTKNTAASNFEFDKNHSFGTVTFNIDGEEQVYLIDPTYKQFFIKENCTKGKLYIGESVSPGYYADKTFASDLLKKGYIKLDKEKAKMYGEPFTKSAKKDSSFIDYYDSIVSSNEDYSYKKEQIEDLNIHVPRTI